VVVCAHDDEGLRSGFVLEGLRRRGIDVPAVVLLDPDFRGDLSTTLPAGAVDFVVKDRVGRYLDRLPHVLERLIADADRARSAEEPVPAPESLSDATDFECQDLPHRDHLERELRRVRSWLAAIVEHNPVGILIELEDGRIGLTNRRFCEMLAIVEEPRDLEGRPWREIVDSSLVLFDNPAHVAGRIDTLTSGNEDVTGETWELADGRTFELDTSRIRRSGVPRGRQWTLRDVTVRQRRERALRWATRMEATATLAGGIAHDFNNLMVAVLGNADLLGDMVPERSDARRMLEQIATAARRAGELSRQMLAYARGGKYRPGPLDLGETVNRVVTSGDATGCDTIRIDVETASDLWTTMADEDQMAMVVMSLLANALEAMDRPGGIRIETGNREVDRRGVKGLAAIRPGRYVVLSIEDSGCGMDPETIARVFEPFFSTKFRGRGLGLAAVYGIVKNHGGYIVVDSVRDRGTTVRVYLPARERAATPR
jgi:PAS domain S-box-containing protein